PFKRPVIRKQAGNVGMAAEGGRLARADQGVDFSLRQQGVEGFAAAVRLDCERAQQRRRVRLAVRAGLLDRSLDPADRGEIDSELMRQVAARPDRRRLSVERQADALASEVLRS